MKHTTKISRLLIGALLPVPFAFFTMMAISPLEVLEIVLSLDFRNYVYLVLFLLIGYFFFAPHCVILVLTVESINDRLQYKYRWISLVAGFVIGLLSTRISVLAQPSTREYIIGALAGLLTSTVIVLMYNYNEKDSSAKKDV